MAEAKEDSTDAGSNNGIIGEPDKTNPLQKLIEGFCSPHKMMARAPIYDDDEDDEDDTANQYAPDLAPQTPTTKQNGNGNDNGNDTLQNQEETQAAQKATTTQPSIPDSDAINNKNTSKVISESATDEDKTATTTKTTMAPTPSADDSISTQESSTPGFLDISKRVTANRRKRGAENFIMACVFVLTTLLTLKKLGYTTSDFDFSAAAGGNGSSSSWIHVFDKSSIEEQGKIKVKAATKKKPPSEHVVVEPIDEDVEEVEDEETSNDYDDISSEAVVDEL